MEGNCKEGRSKNYTIIIVALTKIRRKKGRKSRSYSAIIINKLS